MEFPKSTIMAHDPNNYWEQLERLEKLIRASELKAGVIFSFHSLIIGLFVDRYDYFQTAMEDYLLLTVLIVLWMLTVLCSVFFCFKCFMPRIESKLQKNVFFFKDAAFRFGSVKDYTKKLMDVCDSDEELFVMLSEQIFIESEIISRKFSSVQKSIRFFALSLVMSVIVAVVWIIIA